jgi:hypothetical protein
MYYLGHRFEQNSINKINKERRRSINSTPTRPSNKNQLQGAQESPRQGARQSTDRLITEMIIRRNNSTRKSKSKKRN